MVDFSNSAVKVPQKPKRLFIEKVQISIIFISFIFLFQWHTISSYQFLLFCFNYRIITWKASEYKIWLFYCKMIFFKTLKGSEIRKNLSASNDRLG